MSNDPHTWTSDPADVREHVDEIGRLAAEAGILALIKLLAAAPDTTRISFGDEVYEITVRKLPAPAFDPSRLPAAVAWLAALLLLPMI